MRKIETAGSTAALHWFPESFTGLARFADATLQRVLTAARSMRERAQKRRQARATYFALRDLDQRVLRDLGFDVSEITSVAAEIAGETQATRIHTQRANCPASI